MGSELEENLERLKKDLEMHISRLVNEIREQKEIIENLQQENKKLHKKREEIREQINEYITELEQIKTHYADNYYKLK